MRLHEEPKENGARLSTQVMLPIAGGEMGAHAITVEDHIRPRVTHKFRLDAGMDFVIFCICMYDFSMEADK